jgi:hypothetical protein
LQLDVGVASSHDLYASLLNQIGALLLSLTWDFETTSIQKISGVLPEADRRAERRPVQS